MPSTPPFKIDNAGASAAGITTGGAITPEFHPAPDISNPQAPPSDKLSAGAERMGSALGPLVGNSGVDAAVRGMVDAATHPLAFPPTEEVR